MRRIHAFLWLVILSTLTACAQDSQTTPTPVFDISENELGATPVITGVTPSPVPFLFSLPTPGAEPISGWRPPLYPIPWSVSPYDHFFFARPIAADQVNWPNPDYRYGGVFFGPNIVHTGVDIPTPEEVPIMAAGPGTVVWVGWGLFTETPGNESDPYGLAVGLRHDFGYNGNQLYTIYAHMSEISVTVGQHVKTGEILGLVGATGATTGPHLHFEVRYPNNSFHDTYNPELWIAPPQGWGVLAGRVTDTKRKTLNSFVVNLNREGTRENYLVKTYGSGGAINPDPYYNENLVLGDLPAGIYKITLRFEDTEYQTWVEIFPGQVSYFTFEGESGFDSERPPAPVLDFLPIPLPITPTPTP
jgi:murein DD-endopeptidase MepM/ murein hydrolase activator NlpD